MARAASDYYERGKAAWLSDPEARAHYERGKAHLREWLKQSEQFNEYRSDRQQAQTSFQ